MSRVQKVALFNLITGGIGLGLVVLWSAVPERALGLRMFFALGALVSTCLMFASLTFLMISRWSGDLRVDERDKLIDRKAEIAGGAALVITVLAATMLTCALSGDGSSVPIWALLNLASFSFLAATVTWAAAILIQYGWGGGDGE